MRRNAATRTSSQSSNKLSRNSTGCFSGGAEFLEFVKVLNKPGTCTETTDSPEALQPAGHPRALCTRVTRNPLVLVTLALPQCWGSFLLSRSESGMQRSQQLDVPCEGGKHRNVGVVNNNGVRTEFVPVLPQTQVK